MEDPTKKKRVEERRDFLRTGAIGLAGGALLAGATGTPSAAAQAVPGSFKYNRLSKENAAVLLAEMSRPH
jgi:hypothetical protein